MTPSRKPVDGSITRSMKRKAATQSLLACEKEGPIVRFQVLSHESAILVKQVHRESDGSLVKRQGGQIPRGSLVSTRYTSLEKYVRDVFAGGVNQYILPANVELGTNVPISPKEFVEIDDVDRTASTMQYQAGPAEITFDHDPNPRSPITVMGPDALRGILVDLFPDAFDGAACGGYASSSSYIYAPDGSEIAGLKGFHLVFAVEDAIEIPDFGERLFKRLWLAGYGYIAISKDGNPLLRTIFDKKPLEPQQPLFSGGAHCTGCEQRRPEPVWHAGGYLKVGGMRELTALEDLEYKRAVESAKLSARAECERIKREYAKTSIDTLVTEGHLSVEQARRVIEARLDHTLLGSDILRFDDHGTVTVAEVLSNLDQYVDSTLADPINGDTAGKAILYFDPASAGPIVFSQAHGGHVFFLKYDLESLLMRLEPMQKQQAIDEWLSPVSKSKMQPHQLEQYLSEVKEKTGIGISALRRSANQAIRQAAQSESRSLMQDPGLYIANLLARRNYNDGRSLIRLESGQFWHYTGTHWAPIKDTVLSGQLQDIAVEKWDVILNMWQAFEKKPATLASLVSSALASLAGRVVIAGDPLRLNSSRPSVINCLNGELWLTEAGPDLRPHRPESYLTSCSTIAHHPDATAPQFEIAVRGMLSLPGGAPMADQDEMFRHVEELLGYSIQTKRNLKAFVVVVGPGDNGKTKITALLQHILGRDAIAFDRLSGVDEGGNRFAAMRLVGKQVLVDDDIDHEYLLPDGLLKKIAEEKPLTGEAKFKDSFSFIAQVVPWLLGNSFPRSRDLTRGMQTRANVLYLPRSFLRPGECDKDHPDRQLPELWENIYKNEMPGVLNRLVDGYYRVVHRKGFAPPASAKKAFDMWLAEANVVARFIEEACERIDQSKSVCTTTSAYSAFNHWCNANGVQPKHRPQQNTFGKRFEELGLRVKHNRDGSGIYGIKIKAEWINVSYPISGFCLQPSGPNVAAA